MISRLKRLLVLAALAIAGNAIAEVTFYERENFQGRSFTTDRQVGNFERFGFNDRASSVVVVGEPWVVCEDVRFSGRCMILRPGEYPSTAAMGLNDRISSVRTERELRAELNPAAAPPAGVSQIVFYEREGFEGRSFTTAQPVGDGTNEFNNRAASVVVEGAPWEICEGVSFSGRCVVLSPGRYPSLATFGFYSRVSSVRAASTAARAAQNRPAPLIPQIVFYEREGFEGRSFTTSKPVGDGSNEFNNRASSVVVEGASWEVCEGAGYSGRCVVLRPGRYPSLASFGFQGRVSSVRDLNAQGRPASGPESVPQIVLYEREGFEGRPFSTVRPVGNGFNEFNNRASSIVVETGSWEICEGVDFTGRCFVLRPGRYPSLAAIGLNNQVSSVRPVRRDARGNERLYDVNITSVRAVVGPPEQRCWVDREQVVQKRDPSIGGAIAGALIGGILGHQVGGGTGKDVATVGGVVAGAVLGSRIGSDRRQPAPSQDLQRCDNPNPQASPAYWDVTYTFRGQEHRVQMATQPGPTITVNEQGEPRA